ncbi:MAG TPA: carboxypeptidase regulatory-like domain-containing protein [Bryobacteraceae bacterium]|nr:carboxypeptidase regulatory-like domain-containing protein [Bryobacteraceae bacterium]
MHRITQGAARPFALVLALALATCTAALAQTSRGTVTGLVSDSQRAAVPNATVELTSKSTNVNRSTQSNESGLYRFDAVEPGSYTLQVKSQGFRSFAAKEFVVGAAQVVTLDADLEIGEVQQVVEVSADALQIQTEAPVRAANITTKQIDELPLASRNPYMLALTAPGVTSNKFTNPSGTFSVNGGRGRSNNFMIDGTDNNDISVAGPALTIANPGLIQEVNVQTSNYDAEFGRAGGAVVNVVTRSGSNDFHGSAGFILDSTYDDAISSSLSNSAEVQARGRNLPGTEQQFDGSLGGRIVRDKTFFHLSFLELRQGSTKGILMQTFTPAGRARFSQLFPRGTNRNADLLLDLTAGNDASFSPFNQDLGNGRGNIEFGRGIFPFAQTLRQRQYGARVDHHFSESDILSGRFLANDLLSPRGGESASFPTFMTSSTATTLITGLTETHVFSPTFTNELRLNYMRYKLDSPLDPENPLGATTPLIAIGGINTTTQFVYGVTSGFPQGRLFNNYTIQDTMSLVKGTHTLRFGVDLMNQRARQAAPFNERGSLTYLPTTAYSGLANFVDDFGGLNGTASRTFGNPFYYPSLYRQAYFIQDRWRASQSLTFSLGLRYEYFGTPMNVIPAPAFTGLYNINPDTLTGPFGQPNKVKADKNNFSPMIGIAYSPRFRDGMLGWLFGDRRTSFRTGYGIGYDSYFNNITSNASATAPNNLSSTVTSATADTPRGTPNFSSLLPTAPPLPSPRLAQTGIAADLVNPYYQRWSFTIQRELPANWLLDLGYVGSKGTKLYATEQLNPLVPSSLRAPVPASVPANLRENRLDPLQGSRNIRTNGASSSYNSFQTELKRRYASGFQFSTSYTWSKAIDNISELFSYGNTASLGAFAVPTYFGGASIDRAVSAFDRPHRWVFNYTYELPWLKDKRNLAGRVLGGWQLSGITAYESGNPYTITNGLDSDGLEGTDRPNFNPLGAAGVRARPDNASPTGYVNPDVTDAAGNPVPINPAEARFIGLPGHSGPNVGPIGNLGRNTERAPAIKNWDVNVVKRFRIREGMSLQLRGEFYNVFNTPQYGTISVSPFAPQQNAQSIPANVNGSAGGVFAKETSVDGGGRVIRWQARLEF